MAASLNVFLVKMDRIFAWILLGAMVFYFISGYGMTKGLVDPVMATKLHVDILPLVIIISFIGHASLAVRLAFMRWHWWNAAGKIIWASFFLALLAGLFYLELAYQRKVETPSATTDASAGPTPTATPEVTMSSNTVKTTPTPTPSTRAATKTFTNEELAKYNGQGGQPAYVAVDGVVYDMTRVFRSGAHYSHYAGQELTTAFYSYHVKSQITKYPVVGKLE